MTMQHFVATAVGDLMSSTEISKDQGTRCSRKIRASLPGHSLCVCKKDTLGKRQPRRGGAQVDEE